MPGAAASKQLKCSCVELGAVDTTPTQQRFGKEEAWAAAWEKQALPDCIEVCCVCNAVVQGVGCATLGLGSAAHAGAVMCNSTT